MNSTHQRILLIGGGHTHCLVLKNWRAKDLKGVHLTLISEAAASPYSGMLTGFISGAYTDQQIHISLLPLIKKFNGEFVQDSVVDIDFKNQKVLTKNGQELAFDILSINTGSIPQSQGMMGAQNYSVPIKPIKSFQARFTEFLKKASLESQSRSIVVIGAGVAGIECSLAFESRSRHLGVNSEIHLIEASENFLPGFPKGAQENISDLLAGRRIHLHLGKKVTEIKSEEVIFSDKTKLKTDFTVLTTSGQPAPWIQNLKLKHHGPFIQINKFLETSKSQVFAAGDVAQNPDKPVPRAGVFAVREAKVLGHNIQALLGGTAKTSFLPQKDFLSLISDGDGKCTAIKGSWFFSNSKLMWILKDFIDRKFVRQFDSLGSNFIKTADKRYLQFMFLLTWICLSYSDGFFRTKSLGCAAAVIILSLI